MQHQVQCSAAPSAVQCSSSRQAGQCGARGGEAAVQSESSALHSALCTATGLPPAGLCCAGDKGGAGVQWAAAGVEVRAGSRGQGRAGQGRASRGQGRAGGQTVAVIAPSHGRASTPEHRSLGPGQRPRLLQPSQSAVLSPKQADKTVAAAALGDPTNALLADWPGSWLGWLLARMHSCST